MLQLEEADVSRSPRLGKWLDHSYLTSFSILFALKTLYATALALFISHRIHSIYSRFNYSIRTFIFSFPPASSSGNDRDREMIYASLICLPLCCKFMYFDEGKDFDVPRLKMFPNRKSLWDLYYIENLIFYCKLISKIFFTRNYKRIIRFKVMIKWK